MILVNPGPLDPLANVAERRQHTSDVKHFEVQQLGLREVKQAMLAQIHPHYVALPTCCSHGQPYGAIDHATLSIRGIWTTHTIKNG